MTENDLSVLTNLKNQLETKENRELVEAAEIHNPVKEVTHSLTSYVNGQLGRLESNNQYLDTIRAATEVRLPEFTVDQLIQLQHEVAQDNNQAADIALKLFRNETSGKTIIDQLRDNSASNAATAIYNSTDDSKVLQVFAYLSSVMSDLSNKSCVGEAEIVDEN